MIKLLTRVASVFLMLVLISTIGLFLSSNTDLWITPISRILTAFTERARAGNERQAPSLRLSDEKVPMTDTPEPEGSGQKPEVELPAFAFPELLNSLPDEARQAVAVLAAESEGNLLMLERHHGNWYIAGGPLYCRIGKEGLTDQKSDGDMKTPTGITRIGFAYAGQALDGSTWPVVELSEGAVWAMDVHSVHYNKYTNPALESTVLKSFKPLLQGENNLYLDIGYNTNGIPGKGAAILFQATGKLSLASEGEISASYETVRRVVEWLDTENAPVFGVFYAESVGWQVESALPSGFVFLSDAVPGVKEQARYASADNFIGRPLAGYIGRRVVVSKEVAVALNTAQKNLERRGLGLLVYDGYRPKRAVEDIFNWLDDETDFAMKESHYPDLDKKDLAGIYLAEYSPHTRGIAVDLTLYDLATGEPLDMGTAFDFFSPASWYGSGQVAAHHHNRRKILREAMAAAGFEPYEKEWWHFNLNKTGGTRIFDFVIPQ